MFRNKLNLNVISRLNKNKPILELTKQQQRHRVNDRELSLSVSPTCLEHIVRKQLDQFAEALTSFFSVNNLTVASFDDVLICGGVANCSLVYAFLQKTFTNTVRETVSIHRSTSQIC